jgi:addiction module RelB/DinJ family antitoxin
MMATTLVQAQVDAALKQEAEAVLAGLGLTVADLVQTLLTRIAREKAVPFEVRRNEEHGEREEYAEYARASVSLEGFRISENAEQITRRYVNGEIGVAELVKGICDVSA